MHSNDVLQMTDTRRLSPQTTSSSGYHSDLSSSTDQSPQLIHENVSTTIVQSTSLEVEKKINKSFTRLSSFIRRQYERARLKLISSKQPPPPIKTCSKATSITPLSYLSENNHIKSSQPSTSIYKRSSFIEPVK
jgi:Rps23 Pro-64 3,4-dihydroxylase Tpa1-like proline 4-hydroxylase